MAGLLNYREDGNADSGPPLLLIHAFAASLHAWDSMVDRLGDEHRLVRVDLLGHGDSAKPRRGYTVAEQADAVCAVLDRLGIEKVVAIGHSGGGDVAVAMIERHAHRLAGVALLGTPPNLTYVELPIAARLLSAPLLGTVLWKALTDRMIRDGLAKTFAPEFPKDASAYDTFARDFRRMTHRSYVRARRHTERYRKQRDLTLRSNVASVPLMVVFGKQDQWVDPVALEGWRGSTAARAELLAGVGHTPIVEAPAVTADLILDFVAELDADANGA